MLNREEAFVILKKYLRNEDNIKFSLASEAIMSGMAKILGMDEQLWSLIGLLHNLDHEFTEREPEKTGNLSAQLLDGLLPREGINAIKANNYMHTDYIPTTVLDKSLIAVSAVTGLIIVTAKTMPSKKLSDVTLEKLIDNFNDTTFAIKYNRKRIGLCADIGINLKDFLEISLKTLQKMSD